MNTTSYLPPVDKLLTYGTCEDGDLTSEQWPNYLALGFGPEHIPDLLRLAMDTTFGTSNSEDPAYCAPVHAWRILGLLHAEAAIEPLITLTEDDNYSDIASDELPEVYGLIGPTAIPRLQAFLADTSHSTSARIDTIGCLAKIATLHPEAKAECVAIITHQLEAFAENDYELNSFLILELAELKAEEALPLIKQAFEADRVDEFIIDWDYTQIKFGLKEPPDFSQAIADFERLFSRAMQPTQQEQSSSVTTVPSTTYHTPHTPGTPKSSRHKDKARRKMTKQSRKKNKKHK